MTGSDDVLAPRWAAPDAIEGLRAAWQASGGSIRVEGLLVPDLALALHEALRGLPHEVAQQDDLALPFQAWRYAFAPEPGCDHPTCVVGRFLLGPAVAWASAVTGLALAPEPDGRVGAYCYLKGGHLDDHNDWGRDRALAWVLGLTPPGPDGGPPWPHERGGWLELTEGRGGPVVLRRSPGWNTLDLFDVRGPERWHRIPLLRDHVERRTLAGWFY